MADGITAAIDAVMEREGGYVNRSEDRGGATKYGITQGTLSAWRGVLATPEDVEAMERAEAWTIYRERYARPIERIARYPTLFALVLDIAVLSWVTTAVRFLQEAVNTLVRGVATEPLAVDGKLGPLTAAAVAGICEVPHGEAALRQGIVVARIPALVRLVEERPSQLVFLEGWVVRTLGFLPAPGA